MKADKACIDVAAGRAPADLVFKNVNVVNVFSEEIITADVAVAGGVIAGVGSYRGRTELDCTDKFLCPGFIDAHIHIESSLAAPFEFARAATRSGTTTIVADPHEIVNVCGAQAVQYLLDATENLPLNVYLMLPSSVPATPFETNGADFTAADMAPFMAHPRVLGLGEVMCYPDVLAARQTVLEKLALAADAGKRADGHAPGLSGRELQAYAAAGIRTEHECTTFAEAAEKLRAGLAVLVREGSAAKNLSVLVNGLLDSDLPADRFLFCTDDKHLDDIARDGHLRWNVRQAISLGMKPVTAIKMATWNAAREYGLRDLGDQLKEKLGEGVVILASTMGGKVSLLAMATQGAMDKGAHAGNLIKGTAAVVGGGGGGRPNMAQAGGKNPEKVPEALETAANLLREQLN